ncbi:hypothetical protein [Alteriqipengyuania sp. 357]
MTRKSIVSAFMCAAMFATAPVAAQWVGPGGPYPGAPNAEITKYYSDSSYREQVGELVVWCDGSFHMDGMITAYDQVETFPCP